MYAFTTIKWGPITKNPAVEWIAVYTLLYGIVQWSIRQLYKYWVGILLFVRTTKFIHCCLITLCGYCYKQENNIANLLRL